MPHLGLIKAEADIEEYDKKARRWIPRGSRFQVDGALQANGDFIFHADHKNERKLVRTTNNGKRVKEGYLSLPAHSWENSEVWSKSLEAQIGHKSLRISNFHGSRGRNSLEC